MKAAPGRALSPSMCQTYLRPSRSSVERAVQTAPSEVEASRSRLSFSPARQCLTYAARARGANIENSVPPPARRAPSGLSEETECRSSAASTRMSIFMWGIFTLISPLGSHGRANFKTKTLRPVLSRLNRRFLLPSLSDSAFGASGLGSSHLPAPEANLKKPYLCGNPSDSIGTFSSRPRPPERDFIFHSGFFMASPQPLKEPHT